MRFLEIDWPGTKAQLIGDDWFMTNSELSAAQDLESAVEIGDGMIAAVNAASSLIEDHPNRLESVGLIVEVGTQGDLKRHYRLVAGSGQITLSMGRVRGVGHALGPDGSPLAHSIRPLFSRIVELRRDDWLFESAVRIWLSAGTDRRELYKSWEAVRLGNGWSRRPDGIFNKAPDGFATKVGFSSHDEMKLFEKSMHADRHFDTEPIPRELHPVEVRARLRSILLNWVERKVPD